MDCVIGDIVVSWRRQINVLLLRGTAKWSTTSAVEFDQVFWSLNVGEWLFDLWHLV
jgi:hypothetical protein